MGLKENITASFWNLVGTQKPDPICDFLDRWFSS